MPRSIIIASSRPGLIRGGRAHPPVKVHDLSDFTPRQIVECVSEPALAVVIGEIVTEATLAPLLGIHIAADGAIEGATGAEEIKAPSWYGAFGAARAEDERAAPTNAPARATEDGAAVAIHRATGLTLREKPRRAG